MTNTTLGPLAEGEQLELRCLVAGGRPRPAIFWYLGERLVRGVRGQQEETVSSSLNITIDRQILLKHITCKVANQVKRKIIHRL